MPDDGMALHPAVDAWLGAVAREGWHGASLESASAGSGIPSAEIMARAGDRLDAALAVADHAAREAFLGAAGAGTARERLFDGLMRGLDVLQARREAVLAVAAARDPGVLMLLAGRSGPALRRLATAAGVGVDGVRGQLRLAALGGLAARLFLTWRQDESPDMAATMAELDRLLERAERAETEGLSADLIGLPGLRSLADRLPWRAGRGDRDPPPSPDPAGE
jgi:hypothetical protein